MTNSLSKAKVLTTFSIIALALTTNQAEAAPGFLAMLEPVAVPEPGATAGLLGLAFLGIAAIRRKLK